MKKLFKDIFPEYFGDGIFFTNITKHHPDAYSPTDVTPKCISHFIEIIMEEFEKFIAYEENIEKDEHPIIAMQKHYTCSKLNEVRNSVLNHLMNRISHVEIETQNRNENENGK